MNEKNKGGAMVKIYCDTRCTSSRRALAWFKKYNIEVDQRRIGEIRKEDLIQVLSISEEGLSEILKRSGKCSSETKSKIDFFMELPLEEGFRFLSYHPEVFQTPIIFDEKKYLIGYNSEEIRKFLPQSYRRVKKQFF